MARSLFKFLKPEDIRKLESFEFAPRALVEGYLAGRHKSRARGSSIEFRDFRQYVPGDDRAMIDWRVYARTDRYYLRTYEQETNMDCHVFLDSSASMGFGHKLTKLEYASFFAAALCYLVVRSSDRVSLQIFDENIRNFFPPGSTGLHLHNLMHALESNFPGNKTSVSQALKKSFPLLKRKGTLIVVSDFFDDPAAVFAALSPYLHRGMRIYLFHVLTPEELDLEERGLITFLDMETKQKVVAHTANLRKMYRQAIQDHINGLRELSVRRNIEYVVARTDTHYFKLFDKLTR